MIFWRVWNNYESWSYANCGDGSKGGLGIGNWDASNLWPLCLLAGDPPHSLARKISADQVHTHNYHLILLSHNAWETTDMTTYIKGFHFCHIQMPKITTMPPWQFSSPASKHKGQNHHRYHHDSCDNHLPQKAQGSRAASLNSSAACWLILVIFIIYNHHKRSQ